MQRKVTVYSVPGCYKCRHLIENIRTLGVEPQVIDCTMLDNEKITELKLLGVPSLQFDDERPEYAADLSLSKLKAKLL